PRRSGLAGDREARTRRDSRGVRRRRGHGCDDHPRPRRATPLLRIDRGGDERMKTRKLGRQGLEVSAEGLGCMGMSEFYGDADEAEAVRTIHRALELGVNFLDTADMYGPFKNEILVGRAIAGRRGDVVVATKFGNVRG